MVSKGKTVPIQLNQCQIRIKIEKELQEALSEKNGLF